MQNSCAKITQVLENSKNLLKNLKQDKNLTLSQALEKKDIRIMSVCGTAPFNNDSKLSQTQTEQA